MKPRIKQNVWGNWNGYLGTKRVIEFGTDETEARDWLARGGAVDPAKESEPIEEILARVVRKEKP